MSNHETIKAPYRVLARKYRPQNFDELIGQDALVQTLKNAIETGRIAHAFMLTGVRGVGKTTTARIIAKALNYTGADGKAGPTTGKTDDCAVCKAITEDRHPDVIEMDAASNTGVDNMREILENVRYAPTSARYKIYIIDEVHMLSKSAFNALLKTLEEPPTHVKFIFATTEIRKVPITVLSRCQKFDLRRVDVDTLKKHYAYVTNAENATIDDEALNLISRAADGSVRDGLSILDQAISMGMGLVTTDAVKSMLGLADRTQILDLYEHIATGNLVPALESLESLYRVGADPASLAQDLLDITHLMTKFKAIDSPPQTVEPMMSADERARVATMAQSMTMSILGRFWSLLLKGMGDIISAPNGQSALEMLIMRMIYAADLPDPALLLEKIKAGGVLQNAAPKSAAKSNNTGASMSSTIYNNNGAQTIAKFDTETDTAPHMRANNNLDTVADIVSLLEQNGALILAANVAEYVELVKLDKTHIECSMASGAPAKLPSDMTKKLSEITGSRWIVSLTSQRGAPTLKAQKQDSDEKLLRSIKDDKIVKSVLTNFADAEIIEFKKL